jgi:hypothetical protein
MEVVRSDETSLNLYRTIRSYISGDTTIYLHTYMQFYSLHHHTLAASFSFWIFYKVGRTTWTVVSLSRGLYLHTGQHKHRINAHTDIHALVGFEPTIPVCEQAKTVHALEITANFIILQMQNMAENFKFLLNNI